MTEEKDFYLEQWAGEFGDKYTERVKVDWHSRIPIFNSLLNSLEIPFVLEIGCNRGHNLAAIRGARNGIGAPLDLFGIEPQKNLCNCRPKVLNANAYAIPWGDNVFSLVFTAGVLIHVPPEKLNLALSEMYRVSSKYIMMIEYEADSETPSPYREFGDRAGVWARPYGGILSGLFPELKLVKYGLMKDLGYDDGWHFSQKCSYWIFEKP